MWRILHSTPRGSPPPALRRRTRAALGVAASLGFFAVVTQNLVFPEPRGPADQGDFTRIFTQFSSGPVGLSFWPEPSDPSYAVRFFHFYHRWWRLEPSGHRDAVEPSTAGLVFLPGRVIRSPLAPGEFDLAWNTALVAALLGTVVGLTTFAMERLVPAATCCVLALVFGDFLVSCYLNSFYQEAGAFVFSLLAAFALVAWLERPTRNRALATFAALGLLAGTKLAYAFSVVLVAGGFATAVLLEGRGRRAAWVVAGVGFSVVLVAGSVLFESSRRLHEGDVAHNFILASVLPMLSEADRADFLAAIGLAPRLVRLSGMDAYEAEARAMAPADRQSLSNDRHATAIRVLAARHPEVLAQLLAGALARSGDYDLTGDYAHRQAGAPAIEAMRIEPWSRFRRAALGGLSGTVLACILLGVLAALARWRPPERMALTAVVATALLAASLLQVAIAVLGNGPIDLVKHLYLGNLLFDVAIVLVLSALVRHVVAVV